MNERPNLMSARTKAELEERLNKARQDLTQARLDKGEAGGASDWHDNAALDEAARKEDLASIQVHKLSQKLRNTELIQPRKETDTVNMGNRVLLKFESEEETFGYNILGPDDAVVLNDTISTESPIGIALLGKKSGETVIYEAGEQKHKVKVVKILPGDF